MRTRILRNKGFGFVEILITVGVLAVGIMGVATLQTVITKQTLDNKSRSEAMSIAQSRIEEMRNYTNSVSSIAEFNTLFANVSNGNSATVAGMNSTFTRTETITTSGSMKGVVVSVAWTDPGGDAQSVRLNTDLSFLSPRKVGDAALSSTPSGISSPTGRARLGDGTLPEGAATTSNGDGTALYYDGGTDLRLASGSQIVLTLQEACQTDTGTCIDFVKINGRIYIDTTTQGSLIPGNVFIVASDAAYCARHYTIAGVTTPVTSATTTAALTSSGDYKYFDYSCYIGGGWFGNVGVLLSGGNT